MGEQRAGSFHPRSCTGLEGMEVKRLMRVNKVTIRELSKRLGITMKRIRQVRELGLDDRGTMRDWFQGITGVDPGELP